MPIEVKECPEFQQGMPQGTAVYFTLGHKFNVLLNFVIV
jgi:hypothetical protein